jgi:hypothetical protein
MLVIREAQMHRFSAEVVETFKRSLTDFLFRQFPVDRGILGDSGMRALVEQAVTRARAHGFDSDGDVRRYVVLGFFFGSAFYGDPQLPWAVAAAADAARPMGRMDRLFDAATGWLRLVAGEHGEHYRHALLRNYRRSPKACARLCAATGETAGRDWLHEVYPNKAALSSPQELDRVLAAAGVDALNYGLAGVAAERAFAGVSFLLGSKFHQDPLYPWVPAMLARAGAAAPGAVAGIVQSVAADQVSKYRRAGANIGSKHGR